MRRSFQVIALLLAALWLPATMHCSFENLGWELLFGCAGQTADSAANDDCADDACQTLESGSFAFSKSEFGFLTAAPALACDCGLCQLTIAPPKRATDLFPACPDDLLPMLRTWQFAFRTAAPPRAPDALNT